MASRITLSSEGISCWAYVLREVPCGTTLEKCPKLSDALIARSEESKMQMELRKSLVCARASAYRSHSFCPLPSRCRHAVLGHWLSLACLRQTSSAEAHAHVRIVLGKHYCGSQSNEVGPQRSSGTTHQDISMRTLNSSWKRNISWRIPLAEVFLLAWPFRSPFPIVGPAQIRGPLPVECALSGKYWQWKLAYWVGCLWWGPFHRNHGHLPANRTEPPPKDPSPWLESWYKTFRGRKTRGRQANSCLYRDSSRPPRIQCGFQRTKERALVLLSFSDKLRSRVPSPDWLRLRKAGNVMLDLEAARRDESVLHYIQL